ncbi:MAG: hypothetical protein IKT34_01505 [Clostridia bacterium]|nr:hypothetical protein [Clostridia bacterium]
MRRAIIFTVLLLVCAIIATLTFFAFRNHESELQMTDMMSKDHQIIDGVYTGKFKCDKTHRAISGYKYEIEDNKLYITVLIAPPNGDEYEIDQNGFAEIKIEGIGNVESVFYRDNEKERELT